MYCACGRPLNLSGAAAGAPQPQANSGGTGSPYLPEGVTLESLHKPARSAPPMWIFGLVFLVCIGVILYFFVFRHTDITKESSWQTMTRDCYTMQFSKDLKDERKRMVSIGSGELIDFFSGEEAAVLINRRKWTDAEKAKFNELGINGVKTEMYNLFRRRTINGVKVEPEVRGDMLYFETTGTKKNYIGKSDDVYEIEATFITEEAVFDVEVFCAEADKDKYKDTLFKWLDTFKPL